jgi:hypothetical protein
LDTSRALEGAPHLGLAWLWTSLENGRGPDQEEAYVRRQTVVLGPLEPVMRAGLLKVLTDEFRLFETRRRGTGVLEEAQSRGATVGILRRDELASAHVPDGAVPALGISCTSWDVILVKGGDFSHMPNPTPEEICRVIKDLGEEAMNAAP